jgi:hypothetical protein
MEELYYISGNIQIDENTRITIDRKILTKKDIEYFFIREKGFLFANSVTSKVTTLIVGWHKDGDSRKSISKAIKQKIKIIPINEFLDMYNFPYETKKTKIVNK